MINFVFLNWDIDGYLYSTEVLEIPFVNELIEKIEKLEKEWGVTSVVPLSDMFWKSERGSISFTKIKEFLKESLKHCQLSDPIELGAYQKLLGDKLRHGPAITKELIDIAQSVIDGGGEYDHIRIIEDFLDDPYSGVSPAAIRAITEAKVALYNTKRDQTPDYGKLHTVKDFLDEIGINNTDADENLLRKPLRIYIDDGMGYGAKNGDVLDVCNESDEVRIWM